MIICTFISKLINFGFVINIGERKSFNIEFIKACEMRSNEQLGGSPTRRKIFHDKETMHAPYRVTHVVDENLPLT